MNLLLTGKPGVGKTTLVERVAEHLAAEGWRLAGFFTRETREAGTAPERKRGERTGFTIIAFSGAEGELARRGLAALLTRLRTAGWLGR